MNGRVYDPALGRFLSVDPVYQAPTNMQSLNPYSYVLNNPLSLVDPSGYDSAEPGPHDCSNGNSCPKDSPSGTSTQTTTVVVAHAREDVTGSHIANTVTVTATVSTGNGASAGGGQGTSDTGATQRQDSTTISARGQDKPATSNPTINFKDGVNKNAVSDFSKKVLIAVMQAAGMDSVTISDTTRTAADQASAMYNNIQSQGVDAQKNLYGDSGKQVIDTFVASQKAGESADQIKVDMTQKIVDIRNKDPDAFKHVGDPSKLNVIDISPRSVPADKAGAFEKAIEGNKSISRHFFPPDDPAYHIEIPQPQPP